MVIYRHAARLTISHCLLATTGQPDPFDAHLVDHTDVPVAIRPYHLTEIPKSERCLMGLRAVCLQQCGHVMFRHAPVHRATNALPYKNSLQYSLQYAFGCPGSCPGVASSRCDMARRQLFIQLNYCQTSAFGSLNTVRNPFDHRV